MALAMLLIVKQNIIKPCPEGCDSGNAGVEGFPTAPQAENRVPLDSATRLKKRTPQVSSNNGVVGPELTGHA